MIGDEQPIIVDTELLEKILGGSVTLREHYIDSVTARVLIDASKSDTAQGKFENALYWVVNAYTTGIELGKATERKNFQERVKDLFGIK